MLWLAHLVWRLECSREGLLAGLSKPGDSYSLRHDAKGTFVHRERVITARCYGCVCRSFALLAACERAPSRVQAATLPRGRVVVIGRKCSRQGRCSKVIRLTIGGGGGCRPEVFSNALARFMGR